MSARRAGGSVATAAGGLYLSACAVMGGLQRSLLYHPQPPIDEPASAVQTFERPDATLRVSVRPRTGNQALLYFGGNAENVAHSLPLLARLLPDRSIYLMHYRGYGGSTGAPTEAHLQADALALFDRVHTTHPDVMVIGRSLGSGIALRVASQRPVSRLVLVTPYDSVEGIAERMFPWLPVRWLLVDKYESWRDAPRVTAPTLVLTAEHDRTVPHWSTERLLTHFAPGVAQATQIAGTDHNSILQAPEYAQALVAFDRP